MSTRSKIGIINMDGSIDAIYCHNDGYPSHQTSILLKSYDTEEKVRELIALGDISCLGNNIKPLTSQHAFRNPDPDTVVAYHRDRGDAWECASPAHYENKKSLLAQRVEPYIYLFKCRTQTWEYTSNSRFKTFTEPVE